jgi:hypothetical protein
MKAAILVLQIGPLENNPDHWLQLFCYNRGKPAIAKQQPHTHVHFARA